MLTHPAFGTILLLLAGELAFGSEGVGPGARVRATVTGAEVCGRLSRHDGICRLTGRLVGGDADHLTVVADGREGTIRVPRSAVTRLEVSLGRSREDGAVIGAGVGLLAGLVLGAVQHGACDPERQMCDLAWLTPVLTVPLGAGIGIAAGTEEWTPASPAHVAATPRRDGMRVALSIRF
jgi:hypothetical protein